MLNHETSRRRSMQLRQLSGYLIGASYLIAFLFGAGGIMAFMRPGGMTNFAGWVSILTGVGIGLLGAWCAAISQTVADNYDLLEDIHHTLSKQNTDKQLGE